jgi:hypothetical protein
VSGTMRLRPRPTRQDDGLSRHALRTLIIPVCLISLAAILPTVLIPHGEQPDLFELTPKTSRIDGYILVPWVELERGYRSLKHGALLYPGAAARALGYVAESRQHPRREEAVRRFVLLPEAGTAPRFGDREIEVHLKPGTIVLFSAGALVWVSGTWQPLAGNPNGERPLYVLEDARVEAADGGDIGRYFR